jgi:hypothetical protein
MEVEKTPRSNVKRMHKSTEMTGKTSSKIIGVNKRKDKHSLQGNG